MLTFAQLKEYVQNLIRVINDDTDPAIISELFELQNWLNNENSNNYQIYHDKLNRLVEMLGQPSIEQLEQFSRSDSIIDKSNSENNEYKTTLFTTLDELSKFSSADEMNYLITAVTAAKTKQELEDMAALIAALQNNIQENMHNNRIQYFEYTNASTIPQPLYSDIPTPLPTQPNAYPPPIFGENQNNAPTLFDQNQSFKSLEQQRIDDLIRVYEKDVQEARDNLAKALHDTPLEEREKVGHLFNRSGNILKNTNISSNDFEVKLSEFFADYHAWQNEQKSYNL